VFTRSDFRAWCRSDADFVDSNRKYAINGFLYGNLPNITLRLVGRILICMHSIYSARWCAKQGAKVRWYLFAMGSEQSLHTAHWHGQTLISHGWHDLPKLYMICCASTRSSSVVLPHTGYRVDTVELLPASFRVADMYADNAGFWMMHCEPPCFLCLFPCSRALFHCCAVHNIGHVNHHIHGGMTALYEVENHPLLLV
jgi:hypothetical protein